MDVHYFLLLNFTQELCDLLYLDILDFIISFVFLTLISSVSPGTFISSLCIFRQFIFPVIIQVFVIIIPYTLYFLKDPMDQLHLVFYLNFLCPKVSMSAPSIFLSRKFYFTNIS